MSLRQQQIAVFCATVVVIFGLLGAGIWLIAQRLTTEATLQTALLMARQVEIALADSLRERPVIVQRQQQAHKAPASFWGFLGNVFAGRRSAPSSTTTTTRYSAPRHDEVRGLMRRLRRPERQYRSHVGGQCRRADCCTHQWLAMAKIAVDRSVMNKLRSGETITNSKRQGENDYYDVWVPLQMPQGVRSPGGLRLWLNPADWTGMLSGLWRQLTLFFVLGGGVALVAAFLTTTLYTRRFRLIADTLRQAEAGTYAARPQYR